MSAETITLERYFEHFPLLLLELQNRQPWSIPSSLEELIRKIIPELPDEFHIRGDVAVHQTAKVEDYATLKGPIIVSAGSFIGAHAYLRGGVFLGEESVIGPGCEVKSSLIMRKSALAHFNFVGDSIVGSMVNFEAGSIIANHFNERPDKAIFSLVNGKRISIGVTKFGAIVGDHSRIGANAVLSPGTLLNPRSIVKRLELVEQC